MNTSHIKALAMSDNGFIFDQASGFSYNTNEVGFHILRLLQNDTDRAGIIKSITDEYEISADRFEHDLDHYVLQLKALGLIEELEEL